MRHPKHLITAASCVWLAACSTPADVQPVTPSNKLVATAEDDGPQVVTGSRIPRKNNDRLIRRTDAAGAKEMSRDQPPNPGPRLD